MKTSIFLLLLSLLICNTYADYTPYTADWSDNASIPAGTNRANIYNLDAQTFEQMRIAGIKHAMVYPVTVTGLLIPYKPLVNFLNSDSTNPLKQLILKLGKNSVGFGTEEEMYAWLGLNKVNDVSATGIYKMPTLDRYPEKSFAGATLINVNGADGLTFSCLLVTLKVCLEEQ